MRPPFFLMRVTLILTGLLAAMTTRAADAPTLKIGDLAPKLETGRWIQGEPVKEFETGKTYLVEFWATWCGPCRVSIPHLDQLHRKFKDKGLVVIGQDVWENDDSQVEPFVKKMGEKMTYRVALDDKSATNATAKNPGSMATHWMTAAGQGGIPTAFVVDGHKRIVWIGHPMQLEDATLEEIIAGKFDSAKAAAEAEAKSRQEAESRAAFMALWKDISQKNWDGATAKVAEMEKRDGGKRNDFIRLTILLGRKDHAAVRKLASEILEQKKEDPETRAGIATQILGSDGLNKDLLEFADKIAIEANEATKGTNFSALLAVVRADILQGRTEAARTHQEKAFAIVGEEQGMRRFLTTQIDSFRVDAKLLQKDDAGAARLIGEMSEGRKDDAMAQNDFAWRLLTDPRFTKRDIDLAEKLAERANELSKGSDHMILDTLARVRFMRGKKAEAIQLEEKALSLTQNEDSKKNYRSVIESYKADKLPPADN